MKTILIVDGADNCAYDCFISSDELFSAIFPDKEQDIEFIEDFRKRNKESEFDELFAQMWKNPVLKKDIKGIDGILFYELEFKKKFYPNKRDSDLDNFGRGFSTAKS